MDHCRNQRISCESCARPVATGEQPKRRMIAKNVLMAQSGVIATMPPDFDFDLKFNVTEYTVMTVIQGFVRKQR